MRTQKKTSQMALCHKIGIEQKYLSSIENGRVEPCLRNIELLAKGLAVPLEKVFQGL